MTARHSSRGLRYKRLAVLPCFVAALAVSGCSQGLPDLPSLPSISKLNPFAEKQQPLPGRRVPVLQTQNKKVAGDLAPADKPIAVPAAYANEGWSQPGGVSSNAPGHLAFGGSLKKTWSADAGTGSSKKGRVTASPIVYGGKVFTLDAASRVSAFSLSGGSAVWRKLIAPERELKGGGFLSLGSITGSEGGGGHGGGLAADGGRLFAASGFGRVVALNPASGKVLWEKELGSPVRASPTAAGDRVFVVTMQGRFYCLSALDGSELWVVRGLPQQASMVMSASPAVDGDIVVVPYPSGDLVALKVSDGSPMWSENLARSRTVSQMAAMSDAARPSIEGGTVFAVGHAGRMIATNARTGERLWSLNVPGTQTPWVAGDSVFVVDTNGQLMAIARTTGKIRWTARLPKAKVWSGPTLAGNALWVISSDGKLVGVDPATGRTLKSVGLGDKVFIPPVVAQGRMFVLTDDAQLLAIN